MTVFSRRKWAVATFRLFLLKFGFEQLDPFAFKILKPSIRQRELIGGFRLLHLRP